MLGGVGFGNQGQDLGFGSQGDSLRVATCPAPKGGGYQMLMNRIAHLALACDRETVKLFTNSLRCGARAKVAVERLA